jgi:Protein of unknown function (DUF2000)
LSVERIAILVDPTLPAGLIANTVATIGVGLGAVAPQLGATILTDSGGRSIHNSANLPVPVLQAAPDVIRSILLKALPAPTAAFVIAFPQFARSIHGFAEYQKLFPHKDLSGEAIEGLGLAGSDKWVRSLTGSLKLLR